MLTLPPGVPVFLAAQPVDLRRSFDGLAQAARDALGRDVRQGGLFLFLNKGRDRVKILFFDGTGSVILYKRLDHGAFALPRVLPAGETGVRLESHELAKLLEGVAARPATATPGAR